MRRITAIFAAAIILSLTHMNASAAPTQAQQAIPAQRLETPSGQPVPRFISLKTTKTNCRSGPSFNHPVRLTYLRKGLPMMVVAETIDYWRKLRDSDGDECWAHRSKLSGTRTALVMVDGLALYSKPGTDAPVRARLGKGVIGRVETVQGDWLRFSTDGMKGWAPLSGFWGVSD